MELTEMIVLIVFLIGAATVAVIGIEAARDKHRNRVDPKDVLARRYAAGEIDEGEYLMRLSILKDANELTP